MQRDTTEGKSSFLNVLFGPMLQRWAEHTTKGRAKYADPAPGLPNWTLATGTEEYLRFKDSAFRHMIQWLRGDRDEDHASAVFFNINGAEYVLERCPEISPTLGAIPYALPKYGPEELCETPECPCGDPTLCGTADPKDITPILAEFMGELGEPCDCLDAVPLKVGDRIIVVGTGYDGWKGTVISVSGSAWFPVRVHLDGREFTGTGFQRDELRRVG